TREQVPEPVDIVVCDASFISLAKVLETPLIFAKPGARLVALVKPQFEAGREEVGKGGVVRDPLVHQRVCDAAAAWVASQGWAARISSAATSSRRSRRWPPRRATRMMSSKVGSRRWKRSWSAHPPPRRSAPPSRSREQPPERRGNPGGARRRRPDRGARRLF